MSQENDSTDSVNWELTTWEGVRRLQMRRWAALPLEKVIEALEEMQQLADQFGATREK